MPHAETLEAIVLTTMDIGEADRFCILFTKERGRIAARARGVRRLESRMGGGILPFMYLHVGLRETSAGYIITGAERQKVHEKPWTIASFLKASQGIEWLLLLLEDGEPLPEVFTLTNIFLKECSIDTADPLLPFSIRLLQILGVLPKNPHGTSLSLSDREQAFLIACSDVSHATLPSLSPRERTHLMHLTMRTAEDHARRAPRAGAVAKQCAV